MQQGVPVYTPSWFSPTGDQQQTNTIGVLLSATPTQPSEDWDLNQYKRRDNTEGCRELGIPSPDFNYVQMVVNIIQTEKLHSLSENSSLTFQTVGFTGVATFLLSEDLDIASAISYESSGITGIAPTKPASTSSVQTGSVRQYNTQSSVKKVNLHSVVLVMSLSPFQRDLVHSSLLVVRQNPAPRHTWLEITSLSLVLRTSTFHIISLVLVLERSVKVEKRIRLTLELSIFLMMSLVEPSLFW